MIKENTLAVNIISTNIFKHVNNYITVKYGSKGKNDISDFQSIFKK